MQLNFNKTIIGLCLSLIAGCGTGASSAVPVNSAEQNSSDSNKLGTVSANPLPSPVLTPEHSPTVASTVGKADPQPKSPNTGPKSALPSKPANITTDLMIEDILGLQSEAYLAKGYQSYTFGTSIEDVEKISPAVKNMERGRFVKLKDGTDVYFSEQGRLVGIAVANLTNDLERSIALLKDTFGAAEKDNITQASQDSETPSQIQRVDLVRATYHFPGSVVVVTLTTTTAVYARGNAKRQETRVVAFERDWVVEQLKKEIECRQDAMNWLVEISTKANAVKMNVDSLPGLRMATAEFVRNTIREGVYWTERPAKPNAKPRTDLIGIQPNSDWVAGCTLNYKQARQPERQLICEYRFNYEKEPTGNYLNSTPLNHLVIKASAVLAQSHFPPRGEQITFRNDSFQSYEWLGADYSRIRVGTGLTGLVIRITKTLDR